MGKGKKKHDKKNGSYEPLEEDVPRRRSGRKKKASMKATDDCKLRQNIESDGSRTVVDISPDGNCLFGSLSDQLYYDFGQKHAEIRHQVCDFMENHKDDFSVFLVLDNEDAKDDEEEDASDFDTYIQTMRQPCEWGGHLELVAAARLYRRTIRVFSMNLDVLTIQHGSNEKAAGPDVLLSYHDNDHYNSVRMNKSTKPPPPVKTYVSSLPEQEETSSMDLDDETTTVVETSNGKTTSSVISDELTATTVEAPNQPLLESIEASIKPSAHTASKKSDKQRVAKNQPCPCGSNLRYKKCCLAREKHKNRLLNQQSSSSVEENICEPAMDGNFRVLHI